MLHLTQCMIYILAIILGQHSIISVVFKCEIIIYFGCEFYIFANVKYFLYLCTRI